MGETKQDPEHQCVPVNFMFYLAVQTSKDRSYKVCLRISNFQSKKQKESGKVVLVGASAGSCGHVPKAFFLLGLCLDYKFFHSLFITSNL